LPRLTPILHEFSPQELCYLLYAYHKSGYLPKPFAKEIERLVKPRLLQTEEITPQEIVLMVNVFCSSRTASRDFHKLLETTILMRLNELKTDLKLIHAIGKKFEETGLCSLDTLKALKKEAF